MRRGARTAGERRLGFGSGVRVNVARAGALVCLLAACDSERRRTQAAGADGRTVEGDTAAAFFARDGILYGRAAAEPVALVAVAGAGRARDTLPLAWPPGVEPAAGFMVGDRIAGVAAAPDGDVALFWTSGVHALVGLARAEGGKVRVLDFLLESAPVAALWAPVPRYVALVTATARGERGLRVYDVGEAAPLALPWEAECALAGTCSLTDVRWEGGTILTVSLQTGAGEVPVPYEVDVEALTGPEPTMEEEP